MDLFSVVHLSKPKLVTEGVRPLRDDEEPLLEAMAGRTMELVLEQPEDKNTVALEPTPMRSGGRETWPKVFEGMPADQLMEEIDMVVAHQAALVA
nr:hypothetical protein [Tanacetum cinerariifolium]